MKKFLLCLLRKLLFGLICSLFFVSSAFSQQLTITAGPIVGPNGHPWANGTAHASLVCPGNAQAYYKTTPIPRDTPTVGLSGAAIFSQVLYDTLMLNDVNQNPMPTCQYNYHVIEQCGIAAFVAPVTGVTGVGPVDLTTQINSYAVNLSPQCDTAGGVTSYQHNGVFVGQQPILNFVDTSALFTVTNDNAHTRVNTSVTGGAGCSLPGNNTAVLSEHPANSCYDSPHATWDDTLYNLQWGFSTLASPANTVGAGATYQIGFGNNASAEKQIFSFGDYNDLRTGLQASLGTPSEAYAFGTGNTIRSLNSNGVTASVGSNTIGAVANAGSGGNDNFALGETNTTYNSQFTTVLNNSNGIGVASSAATQKWGVVAGYNNGVNCCVANASGHNVTDFGILGDLNDIGASDPGGNAVNDAFIGGFSNHCESADGVNGGCYIWGLDNWFFGGQGPDVVIVGSSNRVRTALNTGTLGAEDNFIGGFLNHSSQSGNFVMLGAANYSYCTVCLVDGFNIVNNANNTVDLGISNAPELIVTSGNVKRTPIGFSNGPVIAVVPSNNPGGSVTGNEGQTCNVSFTGGTGSGGTGVLYLTSPNTAAGGFMGITTGGSYTLAPTGGTLSNGTATCSGSLHAFTSATLGISPACSASTEGSFSAFVDSTVSTGGAVISGGGSNHVLGYCNGTNWIVAAGSGSNNLQFVNQNLASNKAISANVTLSIDSVTVSALPAACSTNGCRMRVSYSYFIDGGVNGLCWVTDGTTNSRGAQGSVTSNNSAYCTDNLIFPAQYSAGATPTITIQTNNTGNATACAASATAAPCNNGNTNVSRVSNMQVEVILSN
jgi:hypothetical protein